MYTSLASSTQFQTTTLEDLSSDSPANEISSPSRIAELAQEILGHLGNASQEIATLNDETRFLSINARIEAARAGAALGLHLELWPRRFKTFLAKPRPWPVLFQNARGPH